MRLRQRTRSLRAVWAPSRVRRLLRHRGLQAATIVAIGCLASLVLAAKIDAADTERASWGRTQTVVVAVAGIERGERVGDRVELRDYPVAVVPPHAATSVDAGTTAKVTLHAGEIVLADRLKTSSDALTVAGSVALTMPVARQVPLIEVGALVDLWSIDSANFSSRRVAARVAVLAFSDVDITVAVPDPQVAEATAASLRPVTVALVG